MRKNDKHPTCGPKKLNPEEVFLEISLAKFDDLTKRAKACEILKEKRVEIDYLLDLVENTGKDALDVYNAFIKKTQKPLTKSEFKLLMEVLD